jgi:hypothetical protein
VGKFGVVGRVVWGIVWWVSDIMCGEVWSGGTCCEGYCMVG